MCYEGLFFFFSFIPVAWLCGIWNSPWVFCSGVRVRWMWISPRTQSHLWGCCLVCPSLNSDVFREISLWGEEAGVLGPRKHQALQCSCCRWTNAWYPAVLTDSALVPLASMKTTSEETTRLCPGAAYGICMKPSCRLTEKLHQSVFSPYQDIRLFAAPVFGVIQAEVHPVSGQELERIWISKLEKCPSHFSMLILVSTGRSFSRRVVLGTCMPQACE